MTDADERAAAPSATATSPRALPRLCVALYRGDPPQPCATVSDAERWGLTMLRRAQGATAATGVGYRFARRVDDLTCTTVAPARPNGPPEPSDTRRDGLAVHDLGGGVVALHLAVDDDDPRAAARAAYRQLIDAGRRLGTPHFVRVWQFFDRIHDAAPAPDTESAARPTSSAAAPLDRYQAFCVGRAQALAEARIAAHHMPAATAIGRLALETTVPGGLGLTISALMAAQPGLSIENPRQTPAHRYPDRYSPRAPAFARATLVEGVVVHLGRKGPACATPENGNAPDHLLFVSGTASIVGHESRHPGDVLAQLDEILANLEALVAEADRVRAACLGRRSPPTASTVRPARLVPRHLRVYLRRPTDVEPVARRLGTWLQTRDRRSDGPVARTPAWIDYALGEICRPELLVEIEGLFSTDRATRSTVDDAPPDPTGPSADA